MSLSYSAAPHRLTTGRSCGDTCRGPSDNVDVLSLKHVTGQLADWKALFHSRVQLRIQPAWNRMPRTPPQLHQPPESIFPSANEGLPRSFAAGLSQSTAQRVSWPPA